MIRALLARLLWPLLVRIGQNLHPFDDDEENHPA